MSSGCNDTSVLQACGLSHRYAKGRGAGREILPVIDPFDLSIERGDFVSIVGPSGCGKTTLLRIFAGLVEPSEGTVLDQGVPVQGPDWRRSLVFQHPQLFPWLTVEQNIAFGPKNRGVSEREYQPKVEELMSLVRLSDFRKALPHELSGGMQQRVSLARSLANEPHILLMDEPLGALDALTREHMQDELKTIWKKTGCTMVLVTHSVEEALYLSTRVVVLSTRPARIVTELSTGFSREESNGKGRKVKSSPGFLDLREELIGHLWND
jgi:taurine transport system ATP-binding protein